MDSAKLGLLTTLVLGIFIVIGALAALMIKKKEKVEDFSIGIALGVIIVMAIANLIPELIETLGIKYIYLFIVFTLTGYMLLKLLDNFIPDHEDGKMNKKEASENLVHIGMITSLAIIIHNIVEGMAVYSTAISSNELGFALMLGIGFHNIPLGMLVASTFNQGKENKSRTILSIAAVSLSTFLGGLIMYFFGFKTINPLVSGSLLSVTLGMLIFIVFNELVPRVKNTKNKKLSYSGIAIGMLILILSTLFK